MLSFTQYFKGYPHSLFYISVFQLNFSVWVNIPWRDEKIRIPLLHLIHTTVFSTSFENFLQLRSFWRHNWYPVDHCSSLLRRLATANFENVLLIHVLTPETWMSYVFLLLSPLLVSRLSGNGRDFRECSRKSLFIACGSGIL